MLCIKYYQGDIVNQKLLIFFILTVFIVGTTLGPVSAMICKDGKKSNDKKAIKYDRKKIKKMKKHEVGRQKAGKLIKICYDDGYFRMVTKKGKIVTYGFGC